MRYDDRLATVLNLIPVGPNVARIQFRQLLDLLGTRGAEERGDVLDRAYLRLSQLRDMIPAQDRATILREPGLRLRSPRLVAELARGESLQAQAAIQAAQLTQEQWVDLIPALPLATRGLLRDRMDLGPAARDLLERLGLGARPLGYTGGAVPEPVAISQPEAKTTPTQPVPPPKPVFTAMAAAHPAVPEPVPAQVDAETISDIVRRIAAFQQAREAAPEAAPPLRDGTTAAITAFDFASDGEGRIVWSEAGVAPMVVGHALSSHGPAAHALRLHQPLRAQRVVLSGAPAITGEWQVDAVPKFDPVGGRFLGHIGRFRRMQQAKPSSPPPVVESEADRLRQLLHELRTPVNAIQGFAEVIQQQLFGPAPHEYRSLAAVIAADSALMLAGFEELDRFAKLDSGVTELTGGTCDFAQVLASTIGRFQPDGQGKNPHWSYLSTTNAAPMGIAELEAERLCWRLLATLSSNAAADDHLEAALATDATRLCVSLSLPPSLASLDDHALFHAPAADSALVPGVGIFGTGFSLRLAAAEARAAGGKLVRDEALLLLVLPLLTPSQNPAARVGLSETCEHPAE
jgi:two-component system OmpR family sensor kinase